MTDNTWPWDDDRTEEMDLDACADSCAYCDGPLTILGMLGRLLWLRCRNCGVECSREMTAAVVVPDVPTDHPF